MKISTFHRLKSSRLTLIAVATLTIPALSVVTAGSANASTGDTPTYPTYTCDTVTVTGPNGDIPGTVVIEGTGNCVPSNGAPATGTELDSVQVVQRSDGTTYTCFGFYGGATIPDTPDSVESIACYVSS